MLTAADRDAFAGRRCLITGAGGLVGGGLARQVAACRPELLTVVDHGEHALFLIERELRERWPALALEVVLADVTRASSVREAIRRGAPHVVFHAAAYKHVTMAERAATAAVRVNVLGTAEMLAALQGTGARFVLISSDKAAAPRSVMGASKRMAELLTLAHASRGFDPLVVRFGNVLASSGSFVDLMLDRIRQGRAIQLTSADATRYFMSLAEAASLVMKAAKIGRSGDTLWLDMGDAGAHGRPRRAAPTGGPGPRMAARPGGRDWTCARARSSSSSWPRTGSVKRPPRTRGIRSARSPPARCGAGS